MYKPTRLQRDLIKKIAEALPDTYYEAKEIAHVKGIDILKSKDISKGDFQGPILPDKLYKISKTDLKKCNHANRLLTVYQDGGQEAVDKYVKEVFELVEGSLIPIDKSMETSLAIC